jgi:hypothetical protein
MRKRLWRSRQSHKSQIIRITFSSRPSIIPHCKGNNGGKDVAMNRFANILVSPFRAITREYLYVVGHCSRAHERTDGVLVDGVQYALRTVQYVPLADARLSLSCLEKPREFFTGFKERN